MRSGTSTHSPRLPPIAIAIYASMVAGPFAGFLALRLRNNGPTLLDPFGLPWPPAVASLVQVACILVVVGAAALALVGLVRGGHARLAGLVSLIVGAVSVVPVTLALFLVTYGDPS